jgi:hypothetical protein
MDVLCCITLRLTHHALVMALPLDSGVSRI